MGPRPEGRVSAGLPEITAVQVLRLNPGDTLVIKLPGRVSPEAAADAVNRVRAVLALDESVKILVLPAEGSVEVLEAPA